MADGIMERLTAALEANTAIHTKVLTALQGGAKAGATAGAGTVKADTATKADTKAAGPKVTTSKVKKTTAEDISAAFGAYLGIKDADERAVRKANVKRIVEYYSAPKATEIEPEKFDEALGFLQQFIDGEEPDFGDGEAEDEGNLV